MISRLDNLQAELAALYTADAGGCARDEALGRYLTGQREAGERAELEGHLEGCAECRAVLAAARETEAVWDAAPLAPRAEQPGIWARLVRWWSAPRLATAAAAAALVMLAVVVWPPADRPVGDGQLVPKGAWQLHVAAEADGRTFRVADGDRLATGTRLGLFYSADRDGFGMILYADEAGEIVRLVPAMGVRSAPLTAGRQVRLPDGAVLSPGSDCEWIVALFSERPLQDDQARRAVRRMLVDRRGCGLDPAAAGLPGVVVQVVRVLR